MSAYSSKEAEHLSQIITEGSKSFSLASRLLPKETRLGALSLYAWCRRADDAVDDPRADASEAVLRLRRELYALYSGAPQSDPVLAAFVRVTQQRSIPIQYPAALLDGMEMDARGVFYDSLDALLGYCFRVAGVVGLMMCHVIGLRETSALRNAAQLGIAMQLTNICRDVAEDWSRGRLYLPQDLLCAHGLAKLRAQRGGPLPIEARAPLRRIIQRLLAEATRYYRLGDQGLRALPLRAAFGVSTARLIYSGIGGELRRMDYDVFAGRAVVPGWRKLLGVLGGLFLALPSLRAKEAQIPTDTLSLSEALA